MHKQGMRSTAGAVPGVITAVALIIALSSPSPALAQDETLSISVGVFVTDRDTKTRIDGETPGSGTPVEVENDLGFDKSDSVFRVDAYYRFNDKHRIDVSVFDLSRSASKQIEKEIDWNDTVYPVETTIESALDLSIYKLAYTWSLLRAERGYLGVTAGLYVADIGTLLSAEASALSSSGRVTAPLPVIGLRGQYDLGDKWTLRGSAEVFALEYGDYSGSLYDVYAGIDYQLTRHVALGVGVNSVRINVGITKPSLDGDLIWRYDGGLLFLKFDF